MAMERGRYFFPDLGVEEEFRLQASPEGRRLSISRRCGADMSLQVWTCEAALDSSWRVLALELSRTAAGRRIEARYGWDDDSWVGQVREDGRSRDICVPMAGGLEAGLPFASFDGAFLLRVGLPPDSQRRVEFLNVALEDLVAVQSHCIVERLQDDGGAARYRWTDAWGRQEFVWVADETARARAEDPHGEKPLYLLGSSAVSAGRSRPGR